MITWQLQIVRFGIVGLTSNAVLILFYLAMTGIGLDPKLVISFSYGIGLAWIFIFNKQWSFSYRGNWRRSSARFFTLYGALYCINLLILLLLVDTFEFSHVLVQAGVFAVYAPISFLVQRYWVYS